MEINEKLIGKRIRERRKYRFGTQENMADKMHITRSTISAWENGNLSSCTLDRLVNMCKWFECDLGYLTGEYSTPRRIRTDVSDSTGLRDDAVQQLIENYTKLKNECSENPYDFEKYNFFDEWTQTGYLAFIKLAFLDTLLSNSVKWEEMARYTYEYHKHMKLFKEDPFFIMEGINHETIALLKKKQAEEAFLQFMTRVFFNGSKSELETNYLYGREE